jgi:hypothetical protein
MLGAFERGPFGITPLALLLHLLSIRSMIWRHGGLPSPSASADIARNFGIGAAPPALAG